MHYFVPKYKNKRATKSHSLILKITVLLKIETDVPIEEQSAFFIFFISFTTCLSIWNGAGGGTRTHTPKAHDFESRSSANSDTPAFHFKILYNTKSALSREMLKLFEG